ncbi:MAG: hypothetical protein Solivirus1_37 [Solivirus sp.]|jgi:hypothetical protein|uniref:Uncharacterized protein n=1 Tax=Solivirus sp. TaxID=2487772 RepID=A0A3G5AFB5_9VIRU|nr:MAG: hypothetical protein Solivirus1_37 [Solivirus sp.]
MNSDIEFDLENVLQAPESEFTFQVDELVKEVEETVYKSRCKIKFDESVLIYKILYNISWKEFYIKINQLMALISRDAEFAKFDAHASGDKIKVKMLKDLFGY